MKNIILTHARTGSTVLTMCFDLFSSESACQERLEDGNVAVFEDVFNHDYSLYKMLIIFDVLTKKGFEAINDDVRVCFLYRENAFNSVVSLCLSETTDIWQSVGEGFDRKSYSEKRVTIDIDLFTKNYHFLKGCSDSLKLIEEISKNKMAITYEEIYELNPAESLTKINNFFESDLDIDRAVEEFSVTRLNDDEYSIVTNIKELRELYEKIK